MGDGVPWELPNGGGDLALAGELLDKAGYPADSDGKRSSLEMNWYYRVMLLKLVKFH